MNKLWNGTGTPSRGEMYLDQDGQRTVLLDEHNGVLVGELIELCGGDSHPAISFSELRDIYPIRRNHVKRTALDITQDLTQDLVGMAFVFAEEIEIQVEVSNYKKSAVVEVRVIPAKHLREGYEVFVQGHWCAAFEAFEELEHIEALVMNFLFDLEAKAAKEQAA